MQSHSSSSPQAPQKAQIVPPQPAPSSTPSKISPFDAVTISDTPSSHSPSHFGRQRMPEEEDGEAVHPFIVEILKKTSLEARQSTAIHDRTQSNERVEGSLSESPKSGQKELKQTKRAIQNRRAQATFRQKKQQRIDPLEAQVSTIPALQEEIWRNNKRIRELEREKLEWEREKAMWKIKHGCPCTQDVPKI